MSREKMIIDELVSDLEPFKKSLPFYLYWLMAVFWLAVPIIYLLLKTNNFSFELGPKVVELVAMGVVGIWAFYHCFRFADPRTHKVVSWQTAVAIFIFMVCLSFYVIDISDPLSYFTQMSFQRTAVEFECSKGILISGFLIGMGSCGLLSKLAPIKFRQISLYGLIGAMSFSVLYLRISCSSFSPEHFLMWHHMTALLGLVVGILLMRFTLNQIVKWP